ncbi:hypothetical protein IWZ03DRAFT_185567 [Phyllosticta citriasiana]|uniref:Uncharacterized protein n=1 Tax=Phyllosticta citriasiana TaxID=595635 RepID=A0ABR1KQJ9_9PEZI
MLLSSRDSVGAGEGEGQKVGERWPGGQRRRRRHSQNVMPRGRWTPLRRSDSDRGKKKGHRGMRRMQRRVMVRARRPPLPVVRPLNTQDTRHLEPALLSSLAQSFDLLMECRCEGRVRRHRKAVDGRRAAVRDEAERGRESEMRAYKQGQAIQLRRRQRFEQEAPRPKFLLLKHWAADVLFW